MRGGFEIRLHLKRRLTCTPQCLPKQKKRANTPTAALLLRKKEEMEGLAFAPPSDWLQVKKKTNQLLRDTAVRDQSSLVALSLSLTGRAAFRHIEDESQPSGGWVCVRVCGFPHFVGYIIINRADSEASTVSVTQIRESTVFPPRVK